MEDKQIHRILTIPNMLSFFRLLLIPVIVWLYIYKEDPVLTTATLALSGITDIADGIIARKHHMISDFGKALDPVADKLTQIALLFCLVTRFRWMLLPLGLLIAKETFAAITGLLVIRKTQKVQSAVWHGKVATVFLYSMMLIHLLWFHIPSTFSKILIGTCTAMVLLSAVLYGRQNLRILLNKEQNHEK